MTTLLADPPTDGRKAKTLFESQLAAMATKRASRPNWANVLDVILRRLELSVDPFAEDIGMGRQGVYKWLSGGVKDPGLTRMLEIAEKLGVPPALFLGTPEEAEEWLNAAIGQWLDTHGEEVDGAGDASVMTHSAGNTAFPVTGNESGVDDSVLLDPAGLAASWLAKRWSERPQGN